MAKFSSEGDEALDLSDIVNKDTVSFLRDIYDEEGYLLDGFFRLFELLGIDDKFFIGDLMKNIHSNKPTYDYERDCFNDDLNITTIKDHSQIKLDSKAYVRLSHAYYHFYTSYSILNDSECITSNDLCFTIDSIDEIYSAIGATYAYLMLNHSLTTNTSEKSIHSLGGASRARKYEVLKNEVFKNWKLGRFHSYAECAREHAVKYDLSTKTIESWLSKEFSKAKDA